MVEAARGGDPGGAARPPALRPDPCGSAMGGYVNGGSGRARSMVWNAGTVNAMLRSAQPKHGEPRPIGHALSTSQKCCTEQLA